MQQAEGYTIQQTKDPAHFREGARMMAATDPWITLGMDYENCLPAFEGICKEVYILEKRKEMTGFIVLQVCGSFNGYIQTLCIKEAYRGNGLGKQLLQFAEERIFQSSPNVFICVSVFNEPAKKLYYKSGFQEVGVLKDFIKNGVDELLLRKTIGQRLGYKAVENKHPE
ncbi:MAG: GNAT family N-acetyltransferase [Bacteroidetes bacterium]|nr:GNAT family N-acetyltransferase [Bacteroidota bacterium]MBS1608853.1 GNAT family N-acetyltransferase [Bacteroidota bacterium]